MCISAVVDTCVLEMVKSLILIFAVKMNQCIFCGSLIREYNGCDLSLCFQPFSVELVDKVFSILSKEIAGSLRI